MINRLKIKWVDEKTVPIAFVNLKIDEGNDARNTFFFIYCQIYNDCSVNKLVEINRLFSFRDRAIVAHPSKKVGKIEKDRVPDISRKKY